MKIITLALIASSILCCSAFADARFREHAREDGRAFEQFLYEQEIENQIDEINSKLDALDEIKQQLDDLD